MPPVMFSYFYESDNSSFSPCSSIVKKWSFKKQKLFFFVFDEALHCIILTSLPLSEPYLYAFYSSCMYRFSFHWVFILKCRLRFYVSFEFSWIKRCRTIEHLCKRYENNLRLNFTFGSITVTG